MKKEEKPDKIEIFVGYMFAGAFSPLLLLAIPLYILGKIVVFLMNAVVMMLESDNDD